MSEQGAPQGIESLIRADDDQASAEARSDGHAVVRFYRELVDGELPNDLIADLTRTWLESYLDSSGLDD